jgi:hypothetical protein
LSLLSLDAKKRTDHSSNCLIAFARVAVSLQTFLDTQTLC